MIFFMIPLKAVFVISVLISGLIFSPSYSFAQSNQDDGPLASFFEAFTRWNSNGTDWYLKKPDFKLKISDSAMSVRC